MLLVEKTKPNQNTVCFKGKIPANTQNESKKTQDSFTPQQIGPKNKQNPEIDMCPAVKEMNHLMYASFLN